MKFYTKTKNQTKNMDNLIFTHPFTGDVLTINPTLKESSEWIRIITNLFADLEDAKIKLEEKERELPFLPEDFEIWPVKSNDGDTIGYQANGGAVIMIRHSGEDTHPFGWNIRTRDENGNLSNSVDVVIKNHKEADIILKALGIVPESYHGSVLARFEVDEEGVEKEEDIVLHSVAKELGEGYSC